MEAIADILTKEVEGIIPTLKASYTIFVVEDSEIYRMFLTRSLARLTNSDLEHKPNCIIHSYASGEECVKDLVKKPDIVVLDYFLNGNNPDAMDGLQLVKIIKEKSPSTEILVLSEQQDVMITAELLHQGVSSYIQKEPQGQNRIQNAILNSIKKIEKERKARTNQAVWTIILVILSIVTAAALI